MIINKEQNNASLPPLIKAIAGAKDTPLILGDKELECYVLEDGTRVFSGNGLQKALNSPSLMSMLQTGSLKEKLTDEIQSKLNHRKAFIRPGAGGALRITYGYDATVLIDICNLLIECREQGLLTTKQEEYARVAQTIISSVAKVGIIGLIDEVTGYQSEREKNELQKILAKYISEDLLPWQKRFPDIYYKELFRLNGWDFTIKDIKKRPGVIGKWTNKLIYEELPPGVMEALKEKTPKSETGNRTARYHQSLSPDIGEPNLTAQINKVITLFQLSDTMKHMWEQFDKIRNNKSNEQLQLDLEFNELGHTKDP